MNKLFFVPIHLFTAIVILGCNFERSKPPESTSPIVETFDDLPIYNGTDLGLTYSPQKSIFKLWSPNADRVKLKFYKTALGGKVVRSADLTRSKSGTWSIEISEDVKGLYYTFQVQYENKFLEETPGIYAKAVGTNGKRAMVVDMKSTNPVNWYRDQRPDIQYNADIILYEIHIRDFTIHQSSGIKNRGKFIGVVEENTQNDQGMKTGLAHLKDLGITHVQFMPVYDYGAIDETQNFENQYSWGYQPQNYNVPEGSYSTNCADGTVRIREFKKMVQRLHQNGIRVIMDVSYNHSGLMTNSCLNLEFPNYYYRQNKNNEFSNASGWGNEIASERQMVRKFIIESIKYWAEEYHIDGFRFDLMGVHDLETMKEIQETLQKVDTSILVYGEGWTAGASPLPDTVRALKTNISQIKNVAVFNDDIRDAIKGHWADGTNGFVTNGDDLKESIKFGIVGAVPHPEIQYDQVMYGTKPWANAPTQSINYVAAHDTYTLYDELKMMSKNLAEDDILRMHRLANTIVMTSQGIPLLQAGAEMIRTKHGERNSYKSPDSINQIDWSQKEKYRANYQYYKNLIRLRKSHPAFCLQTTKLLQKHLKFITFSQTGVVGYKLVDHAGGDPAKSIMVVFNATPIAQEIPIPKGNWVSLLHDEKFTLKGGSSIKNSTTSVPRISVLVLMERE